MSCAAIDVSDHGGAESIAAGSRADVLHSDHHRIRIADLSRESDGKVERQTPTQQDSERRYTYCKQAK